MRYYDVLEPAELNPKEFDLLLSLGWYPMGQKIFTTSHLYQEQDDNPLKVFWLRYSLESLEERPSHGRIKRKNKTFEIEWLDPFKHQEDLDRLYQKYFYSVDFDGYPSVESASFFRDQTNIYQSKAIIIRDKGKLIACGIFSEGGESVASILHFYDPEYSRFSLGKYLILKTIDYCKAHSIKWYYPGYVIQGNPKMDYKLFLGREKALYYEPDKTNFLTGSWLPFMERIRD